MKELVSVIVPVYNVEKYIEKCIQSILGQTYQNIELILVNDGSLQDEEEIIMRYCLQDKRIRYLKNERNLGLFRTRIRGIKAAKGKYIAIIDSDDYINMDFLRLLVKKAEEENADMVFASTVLNTPRGKKTIHILQDVELQKLPAEDENVKKVFFESAGTAYVWHTIWNKLYTRELWLKALPYLEVLDEHIVMTEDIAFSSVLFYYANKVVRSENSVYFYCQHEDASTSTKFMTFDIYMKKVSDIVKVFDFVEDFYRDKEEWIQDKVAEFRKYYARIWKGGIINIEEGKRKEAEELIQAFCPEPGEQTAIEDNYFNLIQVPYSELLENAKAKIWNSNQEYISFDIFDTVITRPFFEPTDLFYFLDKTYENRMWAGVSFYTIRIEGEQACRELKCTSEKEDVTLDEIYKYIQETYGISKAVCDELKRKECDLEVRFSQNRRTVHELYDLAKAAGKKVIFISDMYLGLDTISRILLANGYCDYEKIYVSSEFGRLKTSGSLYKLVLQDLGINAADMIHLGDDFRKDILKASELGIETIYIPKATDVLSGKIENVKTNRCLNIGKEAAGIYRGEKGFEKHSAYGCMTALAATNYFDNPFCSFHPMTDFNIDPYFIGYYLLGMNLIGQIQWIEKIRNSHEVSRVIFTARDGYLLKQAYDSFNNIRGERVQTEYMYTSRRAMLPAMLQTKADFMNLPIVYQRYTPVMILELLDFCTKDSSDEKWVGLCQSEGIAETKNFKNIAEYHKFMNLYFEFLYDAEKHKKKVEILRSYWSGVTDSDYIYDMGYSASIHNAIVKLCNQEPVAMFIHKDKNKHNFMRRTGNFEIETFMDSIPNISGLMREHFFSDLGGSCIGYKKQGDEIEVILEEEEKCYSDTFPIAMMQKAALKMVSDFYNKFYEYISYLDFRLDEIQMPFEGFLCAPSKLDTKIFAASYFEDKVYGAQEKLNIRDFWLNLLFGLPGFGGEDISSNMDKYVQEKGKKQLAFFGTGRMCVDILEKSAIPVTVFFDNNPEKEGMKWHGGTIHKPENIDNLKDYFIVIVCAAYMEIGEQLEEMGLVHFEDYINYMELF